MKRKELLALITKYEQGNISEQERADLFRYYESFDEPGKEDVDEMLSSDLKRAMYANIRQEIARQPRSVVRFLWLRAVAAAVLVFFLLGAALWIYQHQHAEQPEEAFVGYNKPYQKVSSEIAGAQLILGDQYISLDSVPVGVIYKQDGAVVRKIDRDHLIVDAYNQKGRSTIVAQLVSPVRRQLHIRLADTSDVQLNANTTLSFPLSFPDQERRLSLAGEAYFDVSRHPEQPFFVQTGDTEIRVLGTEFNLSSYPDDRDVYTTLIEGSVQLTCGNEVFKIKPGVQSVTHAGQASRHIRADMDKILAWKSGKFHFAQQSLEEIMKILQRYYGTRELQYLEGVDKKRQFSGVLSHQENMEEMLYVLEQSLGIHFKTDERRITVMP